MESRIAGRNRRRLALSVVGVLSVALIAMVLLGGLTAGSSEATTIVSMSSVTGNFYTNPTDSGAFTATSSDTAVFSQTFPVIDFNPPTAAQTILGCTNSTGVNENSRPFTDVVLQPNLSCTTVVAQGNSEQAGVSSLNAFDAEFTGSFSVSSASVVVFNFFSDDGWVLAIGPDGGNQPTYGAPGTTAGCPSSPLINPPASGAFTQYQVVGSYNQTSAPTQNNLCVTFPAAGTYPFELDYTECCGGSLALTVTANGVPIAQGTPTPGAPAIVNTATPTSSPTAPATATPVPATSTPVPRNTAAPPPPQPTATPPGGGVAGVIAGPNTGSGPGGSSVPWALIALAMTLVSGGAVLSVAALRAQRR